MKKAVPFISTAFTVFAVLSVLSLLMIAGCREKTQFERTLDGINKIDAEHYMNIDDYQYGMDYLKYHPRYPVPTNDEDIPGIVEELKEARDKTMNDRPSFLLADARIELLEAEKYYKIGKKYPLKGSVEDGFNCGDREVIIESVRNLNLSVYHGRAAIADLEEFQADHPKEAAVVDITRYWVKSVNETFDELAEKARKNERTINYFCLNQTDEEDPDLDQEFMSIREAMKEGGTPVSTGS